MPARPATPIAALDIPEAGQGEPAASGPARRAPQAPSRLLVLHALWLPEGRSGPGLLLWAESARRRGWRGPGGALRHPFSAPAAELRGAVLGLEAARRAGTGLVLPRRGDAPAASSPLLREALGLEEGPAEAFGAWNVEGLLLEPGRGLRWLLELPATEELREAGVLLSDDLRFWRAGALLAWELLAGEHFLPVLAVDGSRAVWEPLLDAPEIAGKFAGLKEALPPGCLSFCLDPKTGRSAWTPEALLRDFLGALVDAEARSAAKLSADSIERTAARTPHDRWLAALAAESPEVALEDDDARALRESLASWRSRLELACGQGLRACLRLREPEDGEGAWRLDYLLQAASDPSLLVGADAIWSGAGACRKLASLSGVNPEERLLAALALAGRLFAPIEASLKRSKPDHARLDSDGALRFLKEAAPALSQSGFGVFLPPWWKAKDAPKLTVRLNVAPKTAQAGEGLGSWLSFDWEVALGDRTLDRSELEELSKLKVPLVRVRGQWLEVDSEAIAKAIRHWEEKKKAGATLGDVLGGMRGPKEAAALEVSDIRAEGWLKQLLDSASGRAALEQLPVPGAFEGTLRPYQERGYSWLAFLRRYGFGACLADDMGLGKTVQALALLLREKEEGRLEAPALLICPTSVAGNWLLESGRFAPGLKTFIHHGNERKRTERAFAKLAEASDLVVTTYALARRDSKLLGQIAWSGILLDEAQNIKNPLAQQSKAVRLLQGGFRVALTGTPVENRLSELWSIMEFLNPGYLGGFDEFHGRFAVPIEVHGDERAASTLKRMAQPFILRRLKSDSSIISDLPEKLEMKVFCTLTMEQATLYRAVVKDMMDKIEAADGISRRGLVLSALTQLKQVLNHPAHFLKDGSALPGRSGKLERLTEMVEEALSEGDSALVFTQYREMGALLKRHLQDKLLEEALFLHGGVPKDARDEMVKRFQDGGARVFILTLKAGGIGLNLTRANHVFHFDRWWNPAVENQATDRAYRIGQTKIVQVHKLLVAGTLEDKIDAMIESKKALAEKVLGAGEGWLTELSDKDLRQVFELRAEALGGPA